MRQPSRRSLLTRDTPRPVTPPGVRGFSTAFTADGKYVLGRNEQQKWALYPIEGGEPIPLPKWAAGDLPINHTTDNHSFFVRNADLPVDVYRVVVVKLDAAMRTLHSHMIGWPQLGQDTVVSVRRDQAPVHSLVEKTRRTRSGAGTGGG